MTVQKHFFVTSLLRKNRSRLEIDELLGHIRNWRECCFFTCIWAENLLFLDFQQILILKWNPVNKSYFLNNLNSIIFATNICFKKLDNKVSIFEHFFKNLFIKGFSLILMKILSYFFKKIAFFSFLLRNLIVWKKKWK